MATVYLAVDRRLDREVALKVLHQHLADTGTGDFVARFRREARTVAKLVHPGLVQVFDQGVDGGTTYLAMEYVDGTNLRQVLVERRALPLGEALDLVEQVLEALAAAHRAGLVHRDVKPENVLISTDGRTKLADFGLARTVTEMTTGASVVMGTAAYLAPELISVGTADARTDVYAVGVLLYEILTGRQPFSGASPVQIAFQHVHNEVPAPSDLVSWMPAEVDDLVRALAARDPANRPVDAAAALTMVKHLRATLDPGSIARPVGIPAEAASGSTDDPAPGPATEASPDSGRDPTVVLPLGLGLGLGPAPGSEPAAGPAPGPGEPPLYAPPVVPPVGQSFGPAAGPPTEDRRRGVLIWMVVGLVALLVLGGGGAVWWFGRGPGATTTVPTVVGLRQAEAEAALRAAHLEPKVTETFHPKVPEGTVISSDPEKGTRLDRDATVNLQVSKGPDWVQVPGGLVGKELTDAVTALTKAGLVSADPPLEDYDDTVPAGTVLRATLPDGSDATGEVSAMRGDTVTLTVSAGPAPVDVPNLVGSTLDAATTQVAGDALTLVPTYESSTAPAGEIIGQDPAAGQPVHRGDSIAVVVSSGPALARVPSVLGESTDNAKQILRDAGFEVTVIESDRRFGRTRIIWQDPVAGTEKPLGTVVTITEG
jgi:serine/threonine-protein kinase